MATRALVAPEDYLKAAFGGRDCEYFQGEVVERGMPTYLHARLQALLAHLFFRLAEAHRLFPATELRLQIEEGRVYRIPDVCLFAENEPSGAVAELVPLVAIEISSRDDRLSETLKKMEEYRTLGVQHLWLIDGEEKQLFVYDADGLHRTDSLHLPQFGFSVGLRDLGL
mgnify:CR=1 FL=1